MLRRSSMARVRRICHLTDVEGDMHYFRRFVDMSTTLRWSTSAPALSAESGSASFTDSLQAASHHGRVGRSHANRVERRSDGGARGSGMSPVQLSQSLDFVDSTSHFVYGGDAFDHGDDITFASILLDFKKRYPERVHLILGNRDINKMVFGQLMQTVDQYTPEEVERHIFRVQYSSSPGSSISKKPDDVSFPEYMRQKHQEQEHHDKKQGARNGNTCVRHGAAANPAQDRVNRTMFLQWALQYKLGCKNTFEHRRRELRALRRARDIHAIPWADGTHVAAPAASSSPSAADGAVIAEHDSTDIDDDVVAESFFAAARPGGVYWEYLQHAHIAVLLDGILFVHGGVSHRSLGFVPYVDAIPVTPPQPSTNAAQRASSSVSADGCAKPAPDSALTGYNVFDSSWRSRRRGGIDSTTRTHEDIFARNSTYNTDTHTTNVNTAPHSRAIHRNAPNTTTTTTTTTSTATRTCTRTHGHDSRASVQLWIDELNRFATESVQSWQQGSGCCGESLRGYAYPCAVVPDSVVVNALVDKDGPHYAALDVVHRLLSDGVHTVCGGHQPTSDSPAIVRQPGGFMMIDADNSYCDHAGSYRHVYDGFNTRGHAVTEIVFTVPAEEQERNEHDARAEHDGHCSPRSNGLRDRRTDGNIDQDDPVHGDPHTFGVCVRGRRVDGQPFDFDVAADDLIGRHVGDGWWVKLRLASCEASGTEYELQRTRDGFRSEQRRVLSRAAVLSELRAVQHEMVAGELPAQYTAKELADTPVHRVKTKVTPRKH